MAYQINRFNSSLLTVVEDGTIDQSTDIKLVGKSYAGYGEIQNENFLFLLENFANNTPPPNPISGQLWYDANTSKLKFYDGVRWRTTGGAEVTENAPVGLTEGDFWWDTINEQLFAYNGNNFVLIGPQSVGEGVTEMLSRTVIDINNTPHQVIVSTINGNVVHIISNEEFFIQNTPDNAIPGFDIVKKGLTLVNTQNATGGVTSTDHVYWGTASNSLKLGGILANEFVQKGNAQFDSLVSFSDAGFVLGDSGDLAVKVPDGTDNKITIENRIGDTIFLGTKNVQGVQNALRVVPNALLPGVTDIQEQNPDNYVARSVTIGTADAPFSSVFADRFEGIGAVAETVQEPGTNNNRQLDRQSNPNTIALRDASGDVQANLFRGTALTARYADLAEIYQSDTDLPVGTLVTICEHQDHEICVAQQNDEVIGAVSANPGFVLNSDASGQAIALVGQTPVRVVGSVNKGERLYLQNQGVASTELSNIFIGISLETNTVTTEKLVNTFLKT